MPGWTRHTGTAVALPLENVDTDQLIPARFMSTPRAEGYGRFLLHDLARDAEGRMRDDFPLAAAPGASILVAGRNFGCGSSREAAVYALVDAGFRAVIAPSFGDIFAGNAVNNGLLPARVTEDDGARLLSALVRPVQGVTIDLERCAIGLGGHRLPFDIDPVWRTKLMNGWDDIDLTRADGNRIATFRDRRRSSAPWAWPAA